jgi:hypothetical protein
MNEAAYVSTISSKIEEELGGKIFKLADRATLGLPDSFHIFKGLTTFLEFKISTFYATKPTHQQVYPWRTIKKDLRQFEVCRQMSKHTLVLYMIYYFEIKYTAVLSINEILALKPADEYAPIPWTAEKSSVRFGHGIPQLKEKLESYRKGLYVRESAGPDYIPGESRSRVS